MHVKQLTLVKGEHKYVFRYRDGNEDKLIDAFVDLAEDRASQFDWFDAAVLSFQLSRHFLQSNRTTRSPHADAF